MKWLAERYRLWTDSTALERLATRNHSTSRVGVADGYSNVFIDARLDAWSAGYGLSFAPRFVSFL